ncbi:msr7097 [Mesorhizobium japonicum MAFF 303099]|uniref:Msr7097 protein n=1 Tax=Mesorhizobium japonicum (strain LMG 29417 / CECT 9101 / MAFF 303099) TaxID=266835 RepID=Q987D4_RHILO|nr:msr7097 [Mesorhizobium japonicum MAFF 303099]
MDAKALLAQRGFGHRPMHSRSRHRCRRDRRHRLQRLWAAVAEAYAGGYRLYGEINQAMIPMWGRIAARQART